MSSMFQLSRKARKGKTAPPKGFKKPYKKPSTRSPARIHSAMLAKAGHATHPAEKRHHQVSKDMPSVSEEKATTKVGASSLAPNTSSPMPAPAEPAGPLLRSLSATEQTTQVDLPPVSPPSPLTSPPRDTPVDTRPTSATRKAKSAPPPATHEQDECGTDLTSANPAIAPSPTRPCHSESGLSLPPLLEPVSSTPEAPTTTPRSWDNGSCDSAPVCGKTELCNATNTSPPSTTAPTTEESPCVEEPSVAAPDTVAVIYTPETTKPAKRNSRHKNNNNQGKKSKNPPRLPGTFMGLPDDASDSARAAVAACLNANAHLKPKTTGEQNTTARPAHKRTGDKKLDTLSMW